MKISSVTRLDFKTEAKKARDHLPANCWQRQAEDPAEQEPEDLSPHTSDSKLEIRLQVQGRGKPWVPQAALLTPSSSPLSLYSGLRPRVPACLSAEAEGGLSPRAPGAPRIPDARSSTRLGGAGPSRGFLSTRTPV